MRIDLSELEREPRPFDAELELEGAALDVALVAGHVHARVEGKVRRIAEGFRIEGRVEASGTLVCSRCLAPVPWSASERFLVERWRLELAPAVEELELDPGDADVVFSDSEELDLEALAAEQLGLALPMKPLCSDACAGLCPSCGADLNAGECGCAREAVDPRWAALAELKRKLDGS